MFFLAFRADAMADVRLGMLIKDVLTESAVDSFIGDSTGMCMGFTEYKNLETAIRTEVKMHEGQHAVGVLTHWGVTLPMID